VNFRTGDEDDREDLGVHAFFTLGAKTNVAIYSNASRDDVTKMRSDMIYIFSNCYSQVLSVTVEGEQPWSRSLWYCNAFSAPSSFR